MSDLYRTLRRSPDPSPAIDEAIRRTIARAIETGELLEIGAEARRLMASYPALGMTRIADLLMRAGVEARINLQLGPPPPAGPDWDWPSPAHHDSSSASVQSAAAA